MSYKRMEFFLNSQCKKLSEGFQVQPKTYIFNLSMSHKHMEFLNNQHL